MTSLWKNKNQRLMWYRISILMDFLNTGSVILHCPYFWWMTPWSWFYEQCVPWVSFIMLTLFIYTGYNKFWIHSKWMKTKLTEPFHRMRPKIWLNIIEYKNRKKYENIPTWINWSKLHNKYLYHVDKFLGLYGSKILSL